MLQPNSRVEMADGIRFYEQDILFDDYQFSKDVQLTLVVDYVSPGFGIVLTGSEGNSLKEKLQAYLFRLGYQESSVIYRSGELQRKLSHTAVNVAPDREGMILRFVKSGKEISMSVDGTSSVIKYTLPKAMDKFSIGFYSNAGNVIRSISVASLVPYGWAVNMDNTDGGYVKFLTDGFRVEDCKDFAEIEQINVPLTAGRHYLKFDRELVQGENDIRAYIIQTGDERLLDEEKNILQEGMFELAQPTEINIKFKGTKGGIRKILLTDKEDNTYIATAEEGAKSEGSSIEVLLDGVSVVSWSGTVQAVPAGEEDRESYAIVSDGDANIALDEALIASKGSVVGTMLKGQKYYYTYFVADGRLVVSLKDEQLATIASWPGASLKAYATKISIFKNVNATIDRFILHRTNGDAINLIAERTSKKYVPGSISSPIVAIDSEHVPLDLSSAYRWAEESGEVRYWFTNYEREYFLPGTELTVSKRISSEPGSVRVYGILKGQTLDHSKMLKIPNRETDGIDLFADHYDLYQEKDLEHLDRVSGEIRLRDVESYQLILVDYLKKDSYAINYIEELNAYEVDISAEDKNISLLYDGGMLQEGATSDSAAYRIVQGDIQKNTYIALRRY